MIFVKILEWDTLSIQKAIYEHLKKSKWTFKENYTLGMSDDGKTAFIIEAEKKKFLIIIYLENEQKQITIKAGIKPEYLPEGKRIPKYSKVFSHTKISEASKYFEEILEDLI